MTYKRITQEDFTRDEMVALIYNFLLVSYANQDELDKFLKKSVENNFKVVCLNNCNIKRAAEYFEKVGAGCIDIVANIGAIKSHDWDLVREDFAQSVKAAKKYNAEIKVILENCYLTKEEIVKASEIDKEVGMDYVKTSTGFGSRRGLDIIDGCPK